MNFKTHVIENELDRAVSTATPLLACICGLVLLASVSAGAILPTNFVGESSILISLLAVITSVLAVAQIYLQKTHRLSDAAVNEIMHAEFHSMVDELSEKSEESGHKILLKLAANQMLISNSSATNESGNEDIDLLQRHIDKCARNLNTSGSRLLILAFSQRIGHNIADLLIYIALLITEIGKVELSFLDGDETPRMFYRDMWFEDIEEMPTVTKRIIYSKNRVIEAIGITIEYGKLFNWYGASKELK